MKRARFSSVTTAGFDQRVQNSSNPSHLAPCLTIQAHPNPERMGERFLWPPRLRELSLSRTGPDFKHPEASWDHPLDDPFLSRKPIRITRLARDSFRIDGSGSGTDLVCDGVAITGSLEVNRARLAHGVVLELADRVVLLFHWGTTATKPAGAFDALVGYSSAMLDLLREISRIADLEVGVLLRGATGTGKELVARAIHDSGDAGRPFVSVNMASIPANLAASELFGATRGAYSGADRDRAGFFAAAHRGTLFLDEIGETPSDLQPLLLRALESGEIQPLGAPSTVRVSVRLIAATDADLEQLVAGGRFREPLLHRIAGYEITLPTLTERREDIGRLFLHFAREELARTGESNRLRQGDPYDPPWLSVNLMNRLLHFSWPGNIRQFRNLVRQLIIGNRGQQRLQPVARVDKLLDGEIANDPAPRKASQIELDEVVAIMERNRFDLKASAGELRISRAALYQIIERSDRLRKASDLSDEEIRACHEDVGGDLEAMIDRLRVSGSALRRRLKRIDKG